MKTMIKKGLTLLITAICTLWCSMPSGSVKSVKSAYIQPNAAAVQGQIGYLLGDLDYNNRVDITDISILLEDYVNYDLLFPEADPSQAPDDFPHANIDGARVDMSQPVTRREDVNFLDAIFLCNYITMKMMMPDITWKDVFSCLGRNTFMDFDRGEVRLYYSNYLHDYILIAKQPPAMQKTGFKTI